MRKNLGIEDTAFFRGNIPMTKQEIRILTLVKAQIQPTDIVWDIGAGTGSLSVEAANLAAQGWVYAVERQPEGQQLIVQNAEKFAVRNLTVLPAEAPAGLAALPACDVVLIGGSGGKMLDILSVVKTMLHPGGRILFNCITIQSVAQVLAWLREQPAFLYEAIQVQVNRLTSVGPYDMAKGMNPIYIIRAVKTLQEV